MSRVSLTYCLVSRPFIPPPHSVGLPVTSQPNYTGGMQAKLDTPSPRPHRRREEDDMYKTAVLG